MRQEEQHFLYFSGQSYHSCGSAVGNVFAMLKMERCAGFGSNPCVDALFCAGSSRLLNGSSSGRKTWKTFG